MSRMSEFWRKLLLLFQRERMERELAEEMEAHIRELTEEKLRTGMSPEEAERAAREQFGEPMRLRSSSRAAFFQEHAVSFTGMAASTPWEFSVRAGGGTEKLIGEVVSPDYFSVLGIPMAVGRRLGRGGRAGEGDALEVVLAYGYWQRALGGD